MQSVCYRNFKKVLLRVFNEQRYDTSYFKVKGFKHEIEADKPIDLYILARTKLSMK